MNVLLIAPAFRYTIEYPSFMAVSDFACGFAYIASALKAAGHQVFGLNPNNAPGYPSASHMIHDKIARAIADSKPDLVGIGGICTDFPFLDDALRVIRHYAPATPVVMGGSIITYDHEFVHSALKPDYSLAGEAEETVVMLADAIENNGDLNTIPNLGYWKDEQAVFTPKNLNFSGDLNARPFPDYSIFDIEDMLDCSWAARYLYRFTRSNPRIMSINCARQCTFTCTFCLHGREERAKYRVRTIENIMDEIKLLYDKYHFNILIVLDELFAVNKARLNEFCNVMTEHRGKYGWDFDWFFQTHANSKLGLEDIKMAKRAGCTFFSYGMESASPTVLKSMKKKTRPDQLSEAIALAEQAEIGFGGNFIFGDPAETPETISETLTFYRKYCADIHCFVSDIRPYPGSALYNACQEMGILPDKLTFYKNIDRFTCNMTKMPDAQWQSYLPCIYALGTHPFCITVNAKRIVRKATRTKMTLGGKRQLWELFADCPHCKREFSYPELVEAEKVVANGQQVLTGCPKCYKRLRINIPVEKGKDLFLEVEKRGGLQPVLQLGIELVQEGRGLEAITVLGSALRLNPDSAEVWNALGCARIQCEELEEAERCFLKAMSIQEGFLAAHRNLGDIHYLRGEWAKAIACYERVLRDQPGDQDALLHLTHSYLHWGIYDAAILGYQRLLDLNPELEEAREGLARAQAGAAGDSTTRGPGGDGRREAPSVIPRVTVTDGTDLESVLQRGIRAMEEGRYGNAEAAFGSALALKPASSEAWNNLGCALAATDRLEEAKDCFKEAIAIAPGNAKAHRNLGDLSYLSQTYQEAILCYEEALRLNSSDLEALLLLTNCYLHQGAYASAVLGYRAVLEQDPSHAEARENLEAALTLGGNEGG